MKKLNIGNRIAEMRKQKGLSQAALSRQSGVSQAAIALIEQNKRCPTLETVRNIALAMNVSLTEILAEDEPDGAASADDGRAAPVTYLDRITSLFAALNDAGQAAAVDAVESLTFNPKYKKG